MWMTTTKAGWIACGGMLLALVGAPAGAQEVAEGPPGGNDSPRSKVADRARGVGGPI
jgi:hypothetical protein